jgi:hypothetical protein
MSPPRKAERAGPPGESAGAGGRGATGVSPEAAEAGRARRRAAIRALLRNGDLARKVRDGLDSHRGEAADRIGAFVRDTGGGLRLTLRRWLGRAD